MTRPSRSRPTRGARRGRHVLADESGQDVPAAELATALRFARDPAVDAHLRVEQVGRVVVGPPAVRGEQAGVDQLQSIEQPFQLRVAAELERHSPLPVGRRELLGLRIEVGGPVSEDQVAA